MFLTLSSTIVSAGKPSNSRGAVWVFMWSLGLAEGCVPRSLPLPTRSSCQGMLEHTGPWARSHRTMSQVVLASTSATCALTHAECSPGTQLFFLPWFPLSIPTLLAKSPSHDGPSVSLTFPLPNPTFLFSNYSQWTKKNEIGKKMFS